jgi:TRAP-type C4-dicarboxylate transport system permease large subunit
VKAALGVPPPPWAAVRDACCVSCRNRASSPASILVLTALLVITYVPWLSLWILKFV